MAYDLIGDIHGYADELKQLLLKLGYECVDGVFQHPRRKVIFLGDFIDRGVAQRAVIDIARPMVEQGKALAVMGNHEFNAIAYHTTDVHGDYLRQHSAKNTRQHQAFLDAYPDESERGEVIAWFKTLPLWLALDAINVVHACWDEKMMNQLVASYGSSQLTDELLLVASNPNRWEYAAIETLLKGKEVDLPNGKYFADKDGVKRQSIRIRWWDNVTNYRDAFIGSENALTHIPDDPLDGDHLIDYAHDKPPVFLGHYWLEPPIEPLAANIACLDYSVAKPGGRLVAYRWDGERVLSCEKFVAVKRSDAL